MDAREFWKEKVRAVEKSKTAVTRNRPHGASTNSGKNSDKVDEAKRRNQEELVEVLRQRRQSSNSPEPCVTSSLRRSQPVSTGKNPSTRDLAGDSNLRDRWKRSTVATSRLDVGRCPTPTDDHRSVSPMAMSTPHKAMNTHDPTVATKMAERINSLKKIAHPPLRPASSADNTRQSTALQQLSLKKRPFSTSVCDVSNASQHDKHRLQPIMDKVNILIVYLQLYVAINTCA